mmetsp:Transcript_30428/g.95494  ORF Transcript_30428/g.95494 Transcript_30428/m.95494 type:complete len:227 (+) Transcript_30428:526-1206(+)
MPCRCCSGATAFPSMRPSRSCRAQTPTGRASSCTRTTGASGPSFTFSRRPAMAAWSRCATLARWSSRSPPRSCRTRSAWLTKASAEEDTAEEATAAAVAAATAAAGAGTATAAAATATAATAAETGTAATAAVAGTATTTATTTAAATTATTTAGESVTMTGAATTTTTAAATATTATRRAPESPLEAFRKMGIVEIHRDPSRWRPWPAKVVIIMAAASRATSGRL